MYGEFELEYISLDHSSLALSRESTVMLESGEDKQDEETIKPACNTPPPKKPTKEVLTFRAIKRERQLSIVVQTALSCEGGL